MTSLQALTVVNYDMGPGITLRSGLLWRWMWKTCASVDQQRLAAVLTAEESVSSYLFLKEKQNEWRKSAQHFLWLVLEKTFIYLLMTVTMQRDLVSTCIFYFKYDVNMCIFSAIKHGLKRTYFSMLLLQSCNMKGFQKILKKDEKYFVHRNNCNNRSISMICRWYK